MISPLASLSLTTTSFFLWMITKNLYDWGETSGGREVVTLYFVHFVKLHFDWTFTEEGRQWTGLMKGKHTERE